MTTTEMSREFDILYNNMASNQAPGLNTYEKSVILTKAQEDEVKLRYSPFNKTKKGFESSEKRRVELRELITPYSSTETYTDTTIAIDDNSLFVKIPDDVYYILQEEVTLSVDDNCLSGKKVKVIPMTHDEYSTAKDNPFRKPNQRKVWRMDLKSQALTNVDEENVETFPVVEIISKYSISEYKMRYLRQPSPIVLETFNNNSEYSGLELSVNGVNTKTECELSEEFQRRIIDKAVEIAVLSYKSNTLQAIVGMNDRNIN